MELTKEIELIILTRMAQKGKVTEKDFDLLFADNNFEYNLALSRIINASFARVSEINQWENTKDKSHCQISELGELRRRVLQKEKDTEKAVVVVHAGLTKHKTIVQRGTKFLLVISILTVLAAMYLIHRESLIQHVHSPAFKAMIAK